MASNISHWKFPVGLFRVFFTLGNVSLGQICPEGVRHGGCSAVLVNEGRHAEDGEEVAQEYNESYSGLFRDIQNEI